MFVSLKGHSANYCKFQVLLYLDPPPVAEEEAMSWLNIYGFMEETNEGTHRDFKHLSVPSDMLSYI